ncbi:MAG TPA: dynamin family protein [Thermohalobaculum sp.]|nr:dynamin family protein [Thermohalobaculum sp.]
MAVNRPIGIHQAARTARVFDLAKQLIRAASAKFAESVGSETAILRNWEARIAVVGQIKAGKSSFINALAGEPGFLPTDVNPWTAAVTNLHYENLDHPAGRGVFNFFTETEWLRLIEGETDALQIAEELLPGFKASTLHRNATELQKRARARLGTLLEQLYGGNHSFDSVTPELLARYVCAGEPGDEGTDGQHTGRYSDITKSADLYRPDGIFACPASVIDTPGINDPFLVRDVLTCQHLRMADIYVVVLSVHQALSSIDQGLIRMLAANGARDVIVFINRIDELDDPGAAVKAIQARIRKTLAPADPKLNLSIEAGSARWGEIARGGNAEKIDTVLASPAAARWRAQMVAPLPESKRGLLLALSGITGVQRALAAAIDHGVGERVTRETAAALTEIIAASRALAQTQLSELTESIEKKAESRDLARTVREQLEARSTALRRTAQKIDRLIAMTRHQMVASQTAFLNGLRNVLDTAVEKVFDEQASALANTIKYSRSKRIWELELPSVQAQLAKVLIREYAEARHTLDGVLLTAIQSADQILGEMISPESIGIDLEALPGAEITPIAPSTAGRLTMELTSDRGWKLWQSAKIPEEQAVERLRQIMRAEVQPVVEGLHVTAERTAAERAAAGIRRFEAILDGVLQALNEQTEAAGQELRTLEEGNSPERIEDSRRRLSKRLDALKNRLAELASLHEELTALASPALVRRSVIEGA